MSEVIARTPIPLEPPIVEIADPVDGLLQISDLNNPIAVGVKVWDAAQPGFYFQLILDGTPVGDARIITPADNIGDIITVYLDEYLLNAEKTYSLSFNTTNPNTEFSNSSPAVQLKVDRSPPGAALLAPLIFPTASFGDRLIGLLPGYAGMARGDVIQTLCNDIPGPAHTVAADELTLRPIEIGFDRELLHSLATDTVLIEYIVTDRAGNGSTTSLPTLVSLQV
ncbi:hypothetical protein [Pseudomonas sp. efr-133-TYG-103a]|uniref:hypothetical protein n=1 Tax=Pseudomonas sp. efr-133-TYG-103a TaxID=3040308 RepID=UPI0025570A49|nr:hypothetical protein [Pseudomonas sp. efr-133-TYG-103a]